MSLIFLFYSNFFGGCLNVYLMCVHFWVIQSRRMLVWALCVPAYLPLEPLSPRGLLVNQFPVSAVTSADTNQPEMRNPIPSGGAWVAPSAWGRLFIPAAFPVLSCGCMGDTGVTQERLPRAVTCKSLPTATPEECQVPCPVSGLLLL